jgi:hypothetical protein
MSVSFFSQLCGSIAATVINPSGGSADFFETNFNASLKLQNVDGVSGYTSKIFICTSL